MINEHTKIGENPLTFTQVIVGKETTGGRMTDRQIDGWSDGQTTDRG